MVTKRAFIHKYTCSKTQGSVIGAWLGNIKALKDIFYSSLKCDIAEEQELHDAHRPEEIHCYRTPTHNITILLPPLNLKMQLKKPAKNEVLTKTKGIQKNKSLTTSGAGSLPVCMTKR